MPVPISREIDDAMKELVQWRVNNAREASTVSRVEGDKSTIELDWDRYPVKAQLHIHKLLLSPICYALVGLLPELFRESSPTTSLVYIVIFILIIKPASRQVPFQQIPGLYMLVSILPLLLPVNIMALTTPMIWLDTFASPLICHILEDISDREEVHYVLISILLCFVSEPTAIALCLTSSLLGTVVIGIVVTLIVQIAAMLVIFWYLDYVPIDVLTTYTSSPFQLSLIRWTCQNTLFSVSHTIHHWLTAFIQRQPHSQEDILIPLESNQSLYDDLPNGSIRLLKVRRGRYQEDISCEFVIASVSSADKIEPYEAISYVWGDPTPSRRIFVDGTALAITESAYDILLRRRSMWNDRMIWMDQVCINQDNENPEKSAQVKMMRQIYSRASLVTAWLGHSSDAHLVQSLIAELHYAKEGLGSSPQELKSHHWYKTKSQEARWEAVGKFIRNR
jgi:hypothetical protein